jgi:hypothetical protein
VGRRVRSAPVTCGVLWMVEGRSRCRVVAIGVRTYASGSIALPFGLHLVTDGRNGRPRHGRADETRLGDEGFLW